MEYPRLSQLLASYFPKGVLYKFLKRLLDNLVTNRLLSYIGGIRFTIPLILVVVNSARDTLITPSHCNQFSKLMKK